MNDVSAKGSFTIYVNKMRGKGFTKCQRNVNIGGSYNVNADITLLKIRNEFLINVNECQPKGGGVV